MKYTPRFIERNSLYGLTLGPGHLALIRRVPHYSALFNILGITEDSMGMLFTDTKSNNEDSPKPMYLHRLIYGFLANTLHVGVDTFTKLMTSGPIQS